MKRILTLLLTLALFFSPLCPLSAKAKTMESAKGETIFFYAKNADGKDVLLKILSLEELEALSHGTDTGENYSFSATDNYPTTQYAEGRGFTLPELVDYIKTTTPGASGISYAGEDVMRFMATDSYGSYNRAWTYNALYGVKRYYFEGLFDAAIGWKTGWEVAGEDNAKYGVTLEEYNTSYKDTDPYYEDKRAVFAGGVETTTIIATQSYSGRTTSAALTASTEPGIAPQIAENGGIVTGSLAGALTDEHALRLLIPTSEADLMAAHRTAYDNFKWIYNIRLDMANPPDTKSQGTVAEPQLRVTRSGDTLTLTLSCATQGAQIYYAYDGAPQISYTQPLTVDVSGRDLSADPVTIYMSAVCEGWDDAGMITAKYPGLSPAFETLYSGMAGEHLVFTAAESVTGEEWAAWTKALTFVTMKTPNLSGYLTVDASSYTIDSMEKTISFDKSLFTESGQYSFIFHATEYSNKNVSIAMKRAAPAVTAEKSYALGGDIVLTFDDALYQQSLSVYLTPPGETRVMISPTYLDRTVPGQVTINSAYFALDSCPAKQPGDYVLTLSNSQFQPDAQDITITLGAGFSDVPVGAWYYDAVHYVAEAGLFAGTSTTTFSPNTGMTRAMFVTVLGRLAGADTVAYTQTGFTDAPFDAWYGPSVAWAADNAIVSGVGNGTFDPDGLLTREQLVTILYRYAGANTADLAALASFPDAGSVSDWAGEAMAWAVTAGVISGSDGKLLPEGTATRAQTAQIMVNYLQTANSY